jgi:copper transport protein
MTGRRQAALATALLGLVALVVTIAIAPAFAGTAHAHAALIRSNPANGERVARPPLNVILNFSEPIERRLTKIEVRDADGERVDDGSVDFDDNDATFASIGLDDIGPGLYTVEFDNVSRVDGHPWSGVIQFIVLNPDGTVPPNAEFNPDATGGAGGTGLLPKNIDSALKWIALLAIAVVAGAGVCFVAVVRPAAAFLEDDDYNAATEAGERWVVNIAHALLPAAFMAYAGLVLITVSRFETSTSLWDYLSSVRTGRYQALILILIVVALAGADLLFLGNSKRKRDAGLGAMVLACAGAMLSFSMISHSATGAGKFWAIASDFMHFAASSVWLGALVLLPLAFRRVRTLVTAGEPARWLYLANMFDRFSILAGVSVIVVMATGLFNGLAGIPEWDALVDTTYGRVLLVKLILIAPLLLIAGLNAFVLKPRFVASIDALYQEGGAAPPSARESADNRLRLIARWLPRTIIVEIALIVAVFAAVGVLTQTSTAEGEIEQRNAAAGATEFRDVRPAGDLTLELVVEPNRVGLNHYNLIISNADGSRATDVSQARLRFFYTDPSQPGLATGQTELLLQRFGDGDYRGSGAYFSQPGSWRMDINIRREGKDDVSRNFVLSVAPAEVTTGDTGGQFDLPFDTFTWNEVVGAALALAGVIVIVYRRQLRWMASWANRAAMSAAAVLLIAGGVLAFGVDTHTAALDPSQGNPIAPTEASIARGRELYQNNCIVCHGVDGRGDGPNAASLDPAPSDFRLHVPLHTDPQFYAFIANGYPGSAMPAWRDTFSEDDIWNLVNFLRETFKEAPTE